jgi:putative ABC transport system ATP-binding protein
MLSTTPLQFTYPGGPALSFPAISCAPGEHWLILGSSVSGKKTFLQLLAGLRTPTGGEVYISDTALSSLSGSALDRFRGQRIGMVFQQSHFIRALNVEENLALAQQLSGVQIDKPKIQGLLHRLGISGKLHARTRELSQGEQQRVAIARALINEPAVILADEPTSSLDDQNAAEVISMLEEQATLAKTALIVVTHDARLKDRFNKCITL